MAAKCRLLVPWVLQIVLSRVCPGTSDSGSDPSSSCPSTCFCNSLSQIVYCSRRGLKSVPDGVPVDSLQLNLNANVFHSGTLRRSNFTRFGQLRHLYMSECGILDMEVDTFADLVDLQWLDLSNNQIRVISPFAFRGLVLQHLFLNGNRHLGLVPQSFEGLKTTGLYLHDCALDGIIADVLRPTQSTLRSLWLNGNQMTSLERPMERIFASLNHLRLSANPLRCNCEMLWLKEMFDTHADKFKGHVPPSCNSPRRLKGRQFDQVSQADFSCQAPSFADIELAFGLSETRLRCSATGDPIPTLYWIQPSGRATRYSTTSEEEIQRNEGVLTIQSEDQGEGRNAVKGMYICVANNDAGNVTLSVNVSWVRSVQPITMTTLSPSLTDVVTSDGQRPHRHPSELVSEKPLEEGVDLPVRLPNPPNESNSTSDEWVEKDHKDNDDTGKLFTVADIVGAVIGTHLCSLVLVLAILLKCCRGRVKPRAAQDRTPAPVSGFMDVTSDKDLSAVTSALSSQQQQHVFVQTKYHRSDAHRCNQV